PAPRAGSDAADVPAAGCSTEACAPCARCRPALPATADVAQRVAGWAAPPRRLEIAGERRSRDLPTGPPGQRSARLCAIRHSPAQEPPTGPYSRHVRLRSGAAGSIRGYGCPGATQVRINNKRGGDSTVNMLAGAWHLLQGCAVCHSPARFQTQSTCGASLALPRPVITHRHRLQTRRVEHAERPTEVVNQLLAPSFHNSPSETAWNESADYQAARLPPPESSPYLRTATPSSD